ncbi:MAG: ABC transporter permease [Desulfomonilaceae bacterium]
MLFFFVKQFFAQDEATLRNYFGVFPTVFVLIIPAITMRSWAEERKMGTDELLLTFPVRDSTLVIGKFLAGFITLIIFLVLTLPVPLTLLPFGYFEHGQIIGEYLGVLFLGIACLSVGYFISAISTNQTTAFLLTVFVLLVVTFIGEVPKFLSLTNWVAEIINYLSVDYHFQSFRKGLFDTRDAMYFIILTFSFLYANTKALALARLR